MAVSRVSAGSPKNSLDHKKYSDKHGKPTAALSTDESILSKALPIDHFVKVDELVHAEPCDRVYPSEMYSTDILTPNHVGIDNPSCPLDHRKSSEEHSTLATLPTVAVDTLILPQKISLIANSEKDTGNSGTCTQETNRIEAHEEKNHSGPSMLVVSGRPSQAILTPLQLEKACGSFDSVRPNLVLISQPIPDNVESAQGGDGGKKPVHNPVETYTRNPQWPYSHIQRLRPEAMVRAGFIFTGKEDIVKCLTCNVQVGQWDKRSVCDPLVIHRQEQPLCPFVQGQTSGSHMPSMTMPAPMMTPAYYSNLYEEVMPSHGAPGSGMHGFSRYATRLESFRNYDNTLPVSKYGLADAGFVLKGLPDLTECFACGMVLKEWEIGDEPMKEHRRLAPGCLYVRAVDDAEARRQQASSQPLDAAVGYDATQWDSRPTSLEVSFTGLSVEARQVPKPLSSRDAHMEAYKPTPTPTGNLTAKLEPPPTTHGAHSGRHSADYRQRQHTQWGGETGSDRPILYPPASRELRRGDVLPQLPLASTFGASLLSTPQYTSALSSAELQSEMKVCRICMDKDIDAIFLPCGHVYCCSQCAKLVRECPICRHKVEKISHAYLPF